MNPEADGKLNQSAGTSLSPPAVQCRCTAADRLHFERAVWSVIWSDRQAPWGATAEIQGRPWTCEKRTGPTKAAG